MRRLLVCFLLCLIPLQFSWAAMTDYYAHQQDMPAQHFGHHDGQHQATHAAPDDRKQPAASDLDHEHCHLWGFLGILSACTLTIDNISQPLLHGDDASYHLLISDQPVRPSWFIPV